jgi:hypothetical protein
MTEGCKSVQNCGGTATVDRKRLTADVARRLRDEEHDRPLDIVVTASTPSGVTFAISSALSASPGDSFFGAMTGRPQKGPAAAAASAQTCAPSAPSIATSETSTSDTLT